MKEYYEGLRLYREKQCVSALMVDGPDAGKKALFTIETGKPEQIAGDLTAISPELISKMAEESTVLADTARGRVFLERIGGKRKLVICGAGHVSMPVIRIGKMLEYEVTVIDDREEYTASAAEAGADRVLCEAFTDALRKTPGDTETAFVIVTREHRYDLECLRTVLQTPYQYAGMMGSKSRTRLVRKQLLQEGYSEESLDQVHMPVGLKIHSQTPEEIAVSIMAEVISVMNAHKSGSGFPDGMAEKILMIRKGERFEKAVLTMIVKKDGEAPREPGARMLIFPDGTFMGTVGGGYAENRILDAGRAMLEGEERNKLITISMHADNDNENTMLCGGEITVYLEVIAP